MLKEKVVLQKNWRHIDHFKQLELKQMKLYIEIYLIK